MAMKIYRNKLYSIQDAAKRSSVKEEDIRTMIKDNYIVPVNSMFVDCIKGEDVPGLKKKWIEYQRIRNIGKGGKNKKLKKINVTHSRLDKGE